MGPIQAILFEPVGCLAEFAAHDFDAIASGVFSAPPAGEGSGGRAYWRLLGLMRDAETPLDAAGAGLLECLERRAVEGASLFEDAGPALGELVRLGVRLSIASSLSESAVRRFLGRFSLGQYFSGVWSRDTAGGVWAQPLRAALAAAAVEADRVLYLAETAEGIAAAREAGVQPILMINDPDEAMRLAMLQPAGGVVSLHELPDFVRLVAAENAARPGA